MAVVNDCLAAARYATPEADVQLTRGTPEALAAVADVDAVARVTELLVDNAVRFGGEGAATVTVGVELSAEAKVIIRVRDAGIGFESRRRGEVFSVFNRLQRREDFPGAGIGLALGRRLATLFGGTLTCTRAQPGLGCTFELRFPQNSRPTASADRSSHPTAAELPGA